MLILNKRHHAIELMMHCFHFQGEIYTENSIVQHCTYAEIYEHNEVYFPIVRPETELVEEEYLAQNFWRPDIPDLDEEDLILWRRMWYLEGGPDPLDFSSISTTPTSSDLWFEWTWVVRSFISWFVVWLLIHYLTCQLICSLSIWLWVRGLVVLLNSNSIRQMYWKRIFIEICE